MSHADGLSRAINILYVKDESFEYVLAASQRQDPALVAIASDLEKQESSSYDMVDGLIYRKVKDGLRFYVPKNMEYRVIQTHHDAMCHIGVEKCYEQLRRTYWFPSMKQRIKDYIKGCLKCAYFSPNSGKTEGTLHSIPKGKLPFDTLHIDHYGPLASSKAKSRFILVVIDGFTKFVKLYPIRSTDTKEVTKCLQHYFECYSRPDKIVSDRATCFSSQEFCDFLSENNIKHIKVATLTPQANGQVERVNRVLTAMLAKECEYETTANWSKNLAKVEFAMNNIVNRSTGFSPSTLLFGVNQKGKVYDKVAEFIKNLIDSDKEIDIVGKRNQAEQNILKNQEYNKTYYDKLHKRPKIYKVGDYVMLRNNVTMAGVNKKLLSKYRGPYEIEKVLNNDRYLVKDLDGMQISRVPYRGICSPANMKPLYVNSQDEFSS